MATSNFQIEILPFCGNNIRETGEECDGPDLNGASCISRGFPDGSLSCASTCIFNASLCNLSGDGDGGNGGGGSSHIIPGSRVPTPPPIFIPNPTPIFIPNPVLIFIPNSDSPTNYSLKPFTPVLLTPNQLRIINENQFDIGREPVQLTEKNIIPSVIFLTVSIVLLLLLVILVGRKIVNYFLNRKHKDKEK